MAGSRATSKRLRISGSACCIFNRYCRQTTRMSGKGMIKKRECQIHLISGHQLQKSPFCYPIDYKLRTRYYKNRILILGLPLIMLT